MLAHFVPKKTHFKANLACYLRAKTRKLFLRESSGLNRFISHTKPTKNEVKLFVSCTLQQTRCIFCCLAQGVEFSDELKNELKVKGNCYEFIQLLTKPGYVRFARDFLSFFFSFFSLVSPQPYPLYPRVLQLKRVFWPRGVTGIVSREFSTTRSC